MKTLLKVMIAVVLGIALLLTGALIWGIQGGNFTKMFDGFNANLKLANRQVLSSADFTEIYVQYSAASVEILPASGQEIVVEEYMSRVDKSKFAQIEKNGSKLNIRSGEKNTFSLFSFNFMKVKLYLPQEYAAQVEVHSSSGSIRSDSDFQFDNFIAGSSSGSVRMAGVTSKNNITLKSTSGGVSAQKLVSENQVDLNSSSGSVIAGTVQAKSLRAQSTSGRLDFEKITAETIEGNASSGSVHVDEIDGNFSLTSSSGSVRVDGGQGQGRVKATSGAVAVQLTTLTGDLEMSSSSGSAHLSLGRDNAFSFEAKVSSGGLHLPEQAAFTNNSDKSASGTVGQGDNLPHVKISSTSGSVTIELGA